MKICISSESPIDFPKELIEKYDIKTVPFTVRLGEKEARDDEITPSDIFTFVDETGVLPQTSAVNEVQYEEHFKKILEEYDEIIHISFSSGLSCACENAIRVAKEMEHVHVIDTKTLSNVVGWLCVYAKQLADKGMGVEEIIKAVEARLPYTQVSLVLHTVEYLHKGGRCSALTLLGAQLFRIRPQIIVNREGKLVVGEKFLGKPTLCVRQYAKSIFKQFDNPDLSVAFISHANATDEMIQIAVDSLKERGFKEIIVTKAGSTICSHAGPKALAIEYFNDGNH